MSASRPVDLARSGDCASCGAPVASHFTGQRMRGCGYAREHGLQMSTGSTQPTPSATNSTHRLDECGDVLTEADLVAVLKISRRTLARRLRSRTFPIPELLSLDKKHRWSKTAVRRYLETTGPTMALRRVR